MDIKNHIINENHTVREALRRLNSMSGSAVMTLLVIDDKERMVGTLTDGDVRRALLAGHQLSAPLTVAMHKDFKSLCADHIDVEKLRMYRQRDIELIPVLRADGTIDSIIDTNITHSVLPLSAILMAGGKGERLRPLTLKTPKPLLEVGGKPIIDYNVEALAGVGVTDITVMTNYLAPMIEEHFQSPVGGVDVKCVREKQFLGTIGAASLVKHKPGGCTLVMNSDLLTTIDFEDMYLTHVAEHADITMAAVPYNVSIPYAILSTHDGCVTALEEKPSYSYYANAGIYIFSNDILASLKSDERADAPDVIEQAIADGRKVAYYPINGTWIDIGSPSDYAHACELLQYKTL